MSRSKQVLDTQMLHLGYVERCCLKGLSVSRVAAAGAKRHSGENPAEGGMHKVSSSVLCHFAWVKQVSSPLGLLFWGKKATKHTQVTPCCASK